MSFVSDAYGWVKGGWDTIRDIASGSVDEMKDAAAEQKRLAEEEMARKAAEEFNRVIIEPLAPEFQYPGSNPELSAVMAPTMAKQVIERQAQTAQRISAAGASPVVVLALVGAALHMLNEKGGS